MQTAKSAWICVAIELNRHFPLQPDHTQVQSGQTAVSSKILATTTAVYNKTKAYNNLTSRKISLQILNYVNSAKIVLMMGPSGKPFDQYSAEHMLG